MARRMTRLLLYVLMIPSSVITQTSNSFLLIVWLKSAASLRITKRMRTRRLM
ncbi:hypothetical protein Goari_006125 [Gossypium aridum]|uniref:Uncharacterized protein n=1 Tax=Gossypium aridum TaxID=34290 RepID=A0A7J8XLY2_GOSAI|nr:hypothetical protein [Gossypium aridum]